MRGTLLLLLLACCHASPAPPKRCDLEVLHLQQTCADIRSGISGYHVFTVMSGEHHGKIVTVPYGEAFPPLQIGNWGIAKLAIKPIVVAGRPSNQCIVELYPDRMTSVTYDGAIDAATLVAFPDEAAARSGRASRCR